MANPLCAFVPFILFLCAQNGSLALRILTATYAYAYAYAYAKTTERKRLSPSFGGKASVSRRNIEKVSPNAMLSYILKKSALLTDHFDQTVRRLAAANDAAT
ncbi:hypothetical protein [Paenibacillus sp. FSL H8-0537]|uniref:hypothetical protein n=1 Tax=Paenibacillus sp. FSL H8-0537 TaxID=2921399 RepID=UPI0031012D08